MKQSILVLGANGFIGRAVVNAIAATDWATPVLGVRAARSAGETAQTRIVDATQLASLQAVFTGISAVVNCVAADGPNMVTSAQALRDAAAHAGSVRIVHLSSMAVYGSAVGRMDESAPLQADLGPYSQGKVAAEGILRQSPHCVIFRPGCVYGPGSEQWSSRFARLLLAHRLGDLGVAGDGACNLVHVADVATAIVRALANPQTDGAVFNLAMDPLPTWNEYLIAFARALRATPVRRLPGWRLRIETKLLAPPLKIAEIMARKARLKADLFPPPIPPSLLRLMGQDIQLDSQRARSDLSMQWRGLDEALDETAQWYRTRGARA